jgi:GYF domain 2
MAEKRWYVRVRGKVLGPFGLAQLRALLDRGQFRRFHEISEDRQTWRSASTLTELFPVAGPAREEPAPAANGPTPPEAEEAPPPVEEWIYVTNDGQQQGPVSREQLEVLRRAGTLHEATLVWKPGLDQWVALGSLPAVAAPAGAAPAGPRSPVQAADALTTIVGWRRVCTGLTLVLVALFILCAAFVLGLFGGLITVSVHERAALAVTYLAVWLVVIVAQVVKTVGFGFCASVPPQTGARGLGIASLVLAIADAAVNPATLALIVASGGLTAAQANPGDAAATARATAGLIAALSVLSFLLTVANPLVFLFYLRAVALALQAPPPAQSFLYLKVLYGAAVFLTVVVAGVFLAFVGSLQAAAAGVVCVFGSVILLLVLAMTAWGIVCLFQLRGVVANQLARPVVGNI